MDNIEQQIEANDEKPPHTQGQKESKVAINKARGYNPSSLVNTTSFLRGISLRQGTNIRFCGFDDIANHILHDWGVNNVVGMGANQRK